MSVTLHNTEFGGITQKELNAGSYLDTVSRQSIYEGYNADVEPLLLEDVVRRANLDHAVLINNQDQPTSMFSSNTKEE